MRDLLADEAQGRQRSHDIADGAQPDEQEIVGSHGRDYTRRPVDAPARCLL